MKKQYIISAFALLSICSASAQNDIDAMRYSQLSFGGTARFNAMGGSMGALGGDISTLSFNPAGIAMFRKSEITITPALFSENTSSTYMGTTTTDRSNPKFNLGNIGLVATFKIKESRNSGWQSVNFGIGNNRTNTFNTQVSTQGDNKTSSLLDTYVAAANGHDSSSFDPFGSNLAWQTWLINPDSAGSNMYNHVIPHYGEQQTKTTTTTGKMSETFVSLGGNYKNRVFIGATVGFVKTSYSESSVYQEKDAKDTINNFNSFTYNENLTTKGSGVNFKFGVIVMATDWLRVGAAVHTPTVLSLSDNYSSSMNSDLGGGRTYNASSPIGSFNYQISTPFKAIGSLGFVIGKVGLVNVDYEYVDYTKAEISSTGYSFADVNSTIRSKYTATGNIRAGGEIRFDPISFRLGYALYGSPFKADENKGADRTSYTAGVGFRENNYFIDFAYVLTKYSEFSYLYDPAYEVSSVKNDYKTNGFMLTFGLRF